MQNSEGNPKVVCSGNRQQLSKLLRCNQHNAFLVVGPGCLLDVAKLRLLHTIPPFSRRWRISRSLDDKLAHVLESLNAVIWCYYVFVLVSSWSVLIENKGWRRGALCWNRLLYVSSNYFSVSSASALELFRISWHSVTKLFIGSLFQGKSQDTKHSQMQSKNVIAIILYL